MRSMVKFYKYPEFWITVLFVLWSYYNAVRALLSL